MLNDAERKKNHELNKKKIEESEMAKITQQELTVTQLTDKYVSYKSFKGASVFIIL